MVESADSKSRFKLHILERGTKYTEKIEIDEDNELEYFHVPAHNDVAESDYLYDFKNVSFKPFLDYTAFFYFFIFQHWQEYVYSFCILSS